MLKGLGLSVRIERLGLHVSGSGVRVRGYVAAGKRMQAGRGVVANLHDPEFLYFYYKFWIPREHIGFFIAFMQLFLLLFSFILCQQSIISRKTSMYHNKISPRQPPIPPFLNTHIAWDRKTNENRHTMDMAS
jgi:hypothetical protein